jgi:hypothetical protein
MGGSSGADHEEVSLINICDVHLIAETASADVACDDHVVGDLMCNVPAACRTLVRSYEQLNLCCICRYGPGKEHFFVVPGDIGSSSFCPSSWKTGDDTAFLLPSQLICLRTALWLKPMAGL